MESAKTLLWLAKRLKKEPITYIREVAYRSRALFNPLEHKLIREFIAEYKNDKSREEKDSGGGSSSTREEQL